MDTCIITSCSLKSWGKLNNIQVSRFNFSLHQKMHYPIELLYYKAKKPNFRLIDNRLIPFWYITIISHDVNTINTKEFTAIMANTIITIVPPFKLFDWNLLDITNNIFILLLHPHKNISSTDEITMAKR